MDLTQEKTERKPKAIRSLMLKEFSLELTGTSVMGALAENGTSETDEGYLFWRSEDILKLQSFETAEFSCWDEGKGSRWVLMAYKVSNQPCFKVSSFIFHFHALEKAMATHSSVLAWRIPGMGEPGGLPSMGSHRVGHDWGDLAAAAMFFHAT